MIKKRLYTPGPTPVPETIQLKMAEPIIHHKHTEFITLFREIQPKLQELFQTREHVLIMASSGTGGLEAVVSCFSSSDEVLVVNGGRFGERWKIINERLGNKVIEIKLEEGESVEPEQIICVLKENPSISHLFLTHSETSVGSATDIKAVAKEVRLVCPDCFIAVDGITSIGCMEFRFDMWGIDAAITGSQKGMMLPPGLSILAISQNGWKKYQSPRTLYFDLKSLYEQSINGLTPFTPAINLIVGLKEALKQILSQDIETLWAHYEKLSKAMQEGITALGLTLFPKKPSFALTVVSVPQRIDGNDFIKQMKTICGMTIANGQGRLKNRIFRISNLGYIDEFDIITALSGIEKVLLVMGYSFELGSGVSAAMKKLWK